MYSDLGSMSVTSSQLPTRDICVHTLIFLRSLTSVNVIWLRGDDIRRLKCDIQAVRWWALTRIVLQSLWSSHSPENGLMTLMSLCPLPDFCLCSSSSLLLLPLSRHMYTLPRMCPDYQMSLFSLVVVLNGDPVDMYIRRYVSVDGVMWGVPVVREFTIFLCVYSGCVYIRTYVRMSFTNSYVCLYLIGQEMRATFSLTREFCVWGWGGGGVCGCSLLYMLITVCMGRGSPHTFPVSQCAVPLKIEACKMFHVKGKLNQCYVRSILLPPVWETHVKAMCL